MIGLIARFLPNLLPGFTALFNPWVLVGGLGVILGAFFYGMHIEAVKFGVFEAQVKTVGEAQNVRTAAKIKTDKQAKLEADNENKTTRAALAAALAKLRASRPGGSFVPAAPVASSRPDLICFDRSEYIGADGKFTAGARGLADEGTAATVDLDTAKTWAAKTLKVEKELSWHK